jgi:pimeloyl-ACP methyl ester carboxylesterase
LPFARSTKPKEAFLLVLGAISIALSLALSGMHFGQRAENNDVSEHGHSTRLTSFAPRARGQNLATSAADADVGTKLMSTDSKTHFAETTSSAVQVMRLSASGEPALEIYHHPGQGLSVLYVHGATFPAALSIDYKIDGKSWSEDLQSRGFDVWSFDLAGYGGSDWPISAPREIPGRADDVARQIARVVGHIRRTTGHSRIAIIAHSWGTIPAGLFAGMHPDWVDRLVLFGPVAQRREIERLPHSLIRLVSAEDQWRSFQSGVPDGQPSPIQKERFDLWARTYLETDPSSATRMPAAVKVPAGPDADFAAAWSGHLPYDPAKIHAPTMIVRGEWDAITRDADATWLINAMTHVPGGVRDIKLSHGAHRMHLEQNRQLLFDATAAFLEESEK